MKPPEAGLRFAPLTPDLWQDLENLFGARGACGGCWCMYWRLPRKEFDEGRGDSNRQALHNLVDAGPPPGILVYRGHAPIGWCAIAPRQDYVKLSTARALKAVDATPVWSITCLFVKKDLRNQGLSVELLNAAASFVVGQGGAVLEGYPVEASDGGPMPAAFAWTGTVPAFERAGFTQVARPSATRAIMRRDLASAPDNGPSYGSLSPCTDKPV